ncbi:unnamed protein product [Moneuplotes crassus]|uniref:Uncharacterized protein n=1 Tax=Euplotes crassus TaxID=5936 RepID=A0AAD2DB47_EUPCR|nr:unnamed protein product [Moneuplotes crassus]
MVNQLSKKCRELWLSNLRAFRVLLIKNKKVLKYHKGFDTEIAEYLLKSDRYVSYRLDLCIGSDKEMGIFLKFVNQIDTSQSTLACEFENNSVNISNNFWKPEQINPIFEEFISKNLSITNIQIENKFDSNEAEAIYDTSEVSYEYSKIIDTSMPFHSNVKKVNTFFMKEMISPTDQDIEKLVVDYSLFSRFYEEMPILCPEKINKIEIREPNIGNISKSQRLNKPEFIDFLETSFPRSLQEVFPRLSEITLALCHPTTNELLELEKIIKRSNEAGVSTKLNLCPEIPQRKPYFVQENTNVYMISDTRGDIIETYGLPGSNVATMSTKVLHCFTVGRLECYEPMAGVDSGMRTPYGGRPVRKIYTHKIHPTKKYLFMQSLHNINLYDVSLNGRLNLSPKIEKEMMNLFAQYKLAQPCLLLKNRAFTGIWGKKEFNHLYFKQDDESNTNLNLELIDDNSHVILAPRLPSKLAQMSSMKLTVEFPEPRLVGELIKCLNGSVTHLDMRARPGRLSKTKKRIKEQIIEKILGMKNLNTFIYSRVGTDCNIFLRNMNDKSKPALKELLEYCFLGGEMPGIQPDYLDYISINTSK